jgi:hypothetical protein
MDKPTELPTVGSNNNIGFTDNKLFSEDINKHRYTRTMGGEMKDEQVATKAIWDNKKPGKYNIFSNNCQVWANSVKKQYDFLMRQKERKKIELEEEQEYLKYMNYYDNLSEKEKLNPLNNMIATPNIKYRMSLQHEQERMNNLGWVNKIKLTKNRGLGGVRNVGAKGRPR